jgi:hypothetical protein
MRVLEETLVAVVEGEHDGLFRELALAQEVSEEVFEPDGAITLTLEIVHLLCKGAGRDAEEPMALRSDVVVDEDRHDLVAVRIDPGGIPVAPRNHDLLTARERTGLADVLAKVLDHPRFVGLLQVLFRQTFRGVAGLGERDDEFLRREPLR